VPGGQVGAPARRRDIHTDLNQPIDTGLRGRADQRVDRVAVAAAGHSGLLNRQIQVGVAVEDRNGQRLGRGGKLPPAAGFLVLAGLGRCRRHVRHSALTPGRNRLFTWYPLLSLSLRRVTLTGEDSAVGADPLEPPLSAPLRRDLG